MLPNIILHQHICCLEWVVYTVSQVYLPLQHGDLVGEEVNKVAFSERLGQEVAHGGARGGEHTGKQQSLIWSKYSSC